MKIRPRSGDTWFGNTYTPWSMCELSIVSLGCHGNGKTDQIIHTIVTAPRKAIPMSNFKQVQDKNGGSGWKDTLQLLL